MLRRDGQRRQAAARRPEDGPAEGFDDAGHRVQAEQRLEALGHVAHGVDDRRGEEPHLQQERARRSARRGTARRARPATR